MELRTDIKSKGWVISSTKEAKVKAKHSLRGTIKTRKMIHSDNVRDTLPCAYMKIAAKANRADDQRNARRAKR